MVGRSAQAQPALREDAKAAVWGGEGGWELKAGQVLERPGRFGTTHRVGVAVLHTPRWGLRYNTHRVRVVLNTNHTQTRTVVHHTRKT